MYLTKVVPIVKIPRPASQILSYFTTQKIEKGALVLVSLRKKKVKALVLNQEDVLSKKIEIKKSEFKLKPILKIKNREAVLNNYQLKLAEWLSEYYWASLGKTFSLFLRQSPKKKEKENPQVKKIKPKNSELIIAPLGYFPEKKIKKNLKENKEILFLVPEKTKEKYWKEKLRYLNSENLIIGTRSKLFSPFSNLGLIILTEEGNKNYKSQMEPKYNTKKTAEKLAEIWGAKLIIISPFPSVETYYLHRHTYALPNLWQEVNISRSHSFFEKADERTSSACQIIDMRKLKPWKPISDNLFKEIKNTIKKNKKTLLFINRKGSATTLLCQDCGWVQKCKNCDLPLTYYLENKKIKMICHYCTNEYEVPRLCKNCQSWNLKTLGVGIQKIEKELKKLFDKEKIFRLDSKIAKTQKEQSKIIENFLNSNPSILLTTSLFLKFPLFEKFSLVGVVSLDSLLCQPDFKIEEEVARKIDSLLFLAKEKFILQTFFPESKAISWIKKDKEFFYKKSLEERKKFNYPPFSDIIKLSIFDKKRDKIIKEGFKLKEKIKASAEKHKIKDFQIIGPSSAFIEKIKGKYHCKLVFKLKTSNKQLKTIFLSKVPPSWKVDIDPEKII